MSSKYSCDNGWIVKTLLNKLIIVQMILAIPAQSKSQETYLKIEYI